jgi:hypothetical protein
MPDTPEVRQGAPGQFAASPGYGDAPAGYGDAPAGYGDAPAGYGDAPAAAPGHGPYGGPAPAFSGQAPAGPGFDPYPPGAPEFPGGAPGFDDGQLGDPFGSGPVYGGQPAAGTTTEDQAPAYSPPYSTPPVQSARAKVTASLKAAKRVKTPKRASRPGRQAQLTVARVEPWSVMKFSFVISLVAFIVLFVAVAVLYGVLSGLGVFDALQRTISSITSSQGSSGFNIQSWLSASRVLGYTGLLGAINVVLITAVSTVGSVLYNITADLAGGIEVTLKETE